jgi:hypothetical protein
MKTPQPSTPSAPCPSPLSLPEARSGDCATPVASTGDAVPKRRLSVFERAQLEVLESFGGVSLDELFVRPSLSNTVIPEEEQDSFSTSPLNDERVIEKPIPYSSEDSKQEPAEIDESSVQVESIEGNPSKEQDEEPKSIPCSDLYDWEAEATARKMGKIIIIPTNDESPDNHLAHLVKQAPSCLE